MRSRGILKDGSKRASNSVVNQQISARNSRHIYSRGNDNIVGAASHVS